MPVLLIAGTAPNPGHDRAWTLGYSKGSGASAPRKTAVQLRPVACLRERALRLRGRAEAELVARTRSEINEATKRFQWAKGEPKALDIRAAQAVGEAIACIKQILSE
jgi:hypothetical protein